MGEHDVTAAHRTVDPRPDHRPYRFRSLRAVPRNQYQMDDAQVLRGRPITSRVEMIVFNHTPRWIVTSKLPVRSASGRIVGTAGVATMAARRDRRSGRSRGWRRRWRSSASTITSRSVSARWRRRAESRRVVSSPVQGYLPVHAAYVCEAAPRSHELPCPGVLAASDRRRRRRVRIFRPEPFHQGVPADHG